jgi:hypothetical protein
MSRTLVVGDLHGCSAELRQLLDAASFGPGDRLVSVGDLVGKGPDGAGVVRFFREGGHDAVRGNHDHKLVAAKKGKRRKPLGPSHRAHFEALREADWAWLAARPLWLELPAHEALVVHGGLLPNVPLDEQDPDLVMNLRSIRPDGSGSKRVDEGEPWAKRWPGPELVVFGHDAIRGLQVWPSASDGRNGDLDGARAIGLDTGCVYGLALSALILPERRIVSVPAARDYAGAGVPSLEREP